MTVISGEKWTVVQGKMRITRCASSKATGLYQKWQKKKTWGTKSEAEGEREGGGEGQGQGGGEGGRGRGRFLLLLGGPEHSHACTLRSLGTFVRRPRQVCLDCFHWNVRNVTDSISENYGWAAGYELNKTLAVSFAFILFLIKRLKFKKKILQPFECLSFFFKSLVSWFTAVCAESCTVCLYIYQFKLKMLILTGPVLHCSVITAQ